MAGTSYRVYKQAGLSEPSFVFQTISRRFRQQVNRSFLVDKHLSEENSLYTHIRHIEGSVTMCLGVYAERLYCERAGRK